MVEDLLLLLAAGGESSSSATSRVMDPQNTFIFPEGEIDFTNALDLSDRTYTVAPIAMANSFLFSSTVSKLLCF
jgi:hypothetical protein